MRKIALVNQKGGCGKTTTAINLASSLASRGKKVLLIDMDPQGHSGLGLGIQPDQMETSTYEVLLGSIPLQQAILVLNENLAGVFSNVVLSAFEQQLAGLPEREYKLSHCLEGTSDQYDFLIIDCPPSVGLLTFNALLAADEVIIPVDPSSFSLNGLEKLLETLQLIQKRTGHTLPFTILATNIDRRTNFGRAIIDSLQTRFPGNSFKTFVNVCTRLREAASLGKPINEYDRHSTACRDYNDLSEEVLARTPAELPRESSKKREIVFSLRAPHEATVLIAGDFTDWVPRQLRLTEALDGPLWQTTMRLRPGTYQYKYLVDGQWLPDPSNHKKIENNFGSSNSIISI